MRHLVIKDQFKRRKSVKAEQKRILLNYFRSDFQFFFKEETAIFDGYLEHFAKNTSLYRPTTRCLLTRRSKGVFKFFALERRILRYQISNGRYTGIRRAFW